MVFGSAALAARRSSRQGHQSRFPAVHHCGCAAPSGFEAAAARRRFLPFMPWAKTLPDDRNWHPGILTIARLKPGFSREQARTEMVGITKRLEQQYPGVQHGDQRGHRRFAGADGEKCAPALLLLLGAVSFVLLIACVNVANLLLARAASAAGKSPSARPWAPAAGRVVRQLLTESVLVSRRRWRPWASDGMGRAWTAAENFRRTVFRTAFSVDPRSLRSGLYPGLSVFTGLVFGLVPALRTAKLDLRETLNEGSRGSTAGPGQHRLRSSLVATEIALAMLLLVGAGLAAAEFFALAGRPSRFSGRPFPGGRSSSLSKCLRETGATFRILRSPGGSRQNLARRAFRCGRLLFTG